VPVQTPRRYLAFCVALTAHRILHRTILRIQYLPHAHIARKITDKTTLARAFRWFDYATTEAGVEAEEMARVSADFTRKSPLYMCIHPSVECHACVYQRVRANVKRDAPTSSVTRQHQA
jgi:hypothetical protein